MDDLWRILSRALLEGEARFSWSPAPARAILSVQTMNYRRGANRLFLGVWLLWLLLVSTAVAVAWWESRAATDLRLPFGFFTRLPDDPPPGFVPIGQELPRAWHYVIPWLLASAAPLVAYLVVARFARWVCRGFAE